MVILMCVFLPILIITWFIFTKSSKTSFIKTSDIDLKGAIKYLKKYGVVWIKVSPEEYAIVCKHQNDIKNGNVDSTKYVSKRGTSGQQQESRITDLGEISLNEINWFKKSIHDETRDKTIRIMSNLATEIFRKLIEYSNIPKESQKYLKICQQYFSEHLYKFNPSDNGENIKIGLKGHYDVTWISVLLPGPKGLQGLIDGKWVSIEPKENCFLIMTGLAAKQCLGRKNCKPLFHQALYVNETRVTLGVFLSQGSEAPHLVKGKPIDMSSGNWTKSELEKIDFANLHKKTSI